MTQETRALSEYRPFIWIVLPALVALVLFGCSSGGSMDDNTMLIEVTRTPAIEMVAQDRVSFTVESVQLEVPRPVDWEFYATEYGIVMAEYLGSVATEGQLNGLFTHVWVPPLEDFTLPVADLPASNQNRALAILNQIISNPDYVGDARVSNLAAFNWDGTEAAYYLMDNNEGNLTLVVGIVPPGLDRLIAASVSAPSNLAQRIRDTIPDMLGNLTVNGQALSGATLNAALPNPLIFPSSGIDSSTSETSAARSEPDGVALPVQPAMPQAGGAMPEQADS
ncbi:MAG: hypothetical protein ACOCYT_04520 [Chloroflexota bacterium]